jgi:energy-coupling factor transporter ATP-binding protein EcfA2
MNDLPKYYVTTDDAGKEVMVPIQSEEQRIILSIYDFIKKEGFTFSQQLITNYYLALKTKPFVILTGISGSGKTKMTDLFTRAVCQDSENQFLLLPIRPDWNDDKYLLGYYNPLTKRYESTPFLDFILKANDDTENPYFVCLDEMNLARVEYYFSTFLSAMESQSKVTLHRNNNNIKTEDEQEIPPSIHIPSNLFFTGTVNMDETTYRFSPKVLDRANTIEFNEINLLKPREDIASIATPPIIIEIFNKYFLNDDVRKNGITNDAYRNWENENWTKIVKDVLDSINKDLEKYNLHFGYRTRDEILRYLYFAENLYSNDFTEDVALDFQIKQKILPKIKGPESVRPMLNSLKEFIVSKNYEHSTNKIDQMLEALQNGYTDYYQ